MSLQPDIAMTVERDGLSAAEIALAVKANLEVSLRLARLVDEFPLSDETEPASVFAA